MDIRNAENVIAMDGEMLETQERFPARSNIGLASARKPDLRFLFRRTCGRFWRSRHAPWLRNSDAQVSATRCELQASSVTNTDDFMGRRSPDLSKSTKSD